eukprot:GHVS01056774.1.p1 GENE.GHVS01056774.1~~GHVS01056774.1.p1  ORF type:complete len:487 (+),score=84.66 GHVS01056774.1:275-1735(+)
MPTQSSAPTASSPSMYKLHNLLVNQPSPNQATNLAFSPHNMDSALAMLYIGTDGNTRQQMKDFYFNNNTPEEAANNLRLPKRSKTNTSCSDNKQLEAGGDTDICVDYPYTIDSANRVYLDRITATATSPPPYSAYQAILAETFDADAQLADFQYQPDVETKKINAWVAERTRQKIRSVLPVGAVTTMARLVLVAALYFKGKWTRPFTPLEKPGSFLSISGVLSATGEQQGGEGGHVVEQDGVRYMAVSGGKSYGVGYYNFDPTKVEEDDDAGQSFEWGMEEEVRKTTGLGCQLVEIPYVGDNIRMVIVMPDNPLQLAKYENTWADNSEQIDKWMTRLEKSKKQLFIQESTFTLPYFKITEETLSASTGKMDIPSALKSMGVSDLFDSSCDLSRIDPTAELLVSDIFHKCTVEVDEKGTVASAATAAVISLRALPIAGVNVKVDRPFIFQIRLRTKPGSSSPADDVVLFMGRVTDVKKLQPPQTVTE